LAYAPFCFQAQRCSQKFEGPQILSNPRAASDVEPVSRILYGVAAADGHSSRPSIAERLKRPTRKFGAPSRHASRILLSGIPSLFGLAPCGVCHAPRHYCAGGALLPHLFTLTRGLRPGRYILCGTFRKVALKPPSRTLSGTLLCGVRTFLSLDRAARETRRPQSRQRPSGSTSATHIIR